MEVGVGDQRPEAYPVRIEGRLDPGLSRWLWLVKWLLAIPHFVVLFFLWLAFAVLTLVAFFAILVTGRYPRGMFDFNVGVLRWTWRVGFYSYAALGTDRYPPFTLDQVPDYPATLEVEYPEQLSRGLVLVKWWLLAIPQYLVVGILVGGGSYAASRADHWGGGWWLGAEGGLVGLLVFFAGIALLFTTRYPRGLFEFVLGLDRWVARVVAYAALMTDRYPPFRLDQGGPDAGGAERPLAVPPVVEGEAAAPEPGPGGGGGGAGRIVLLVLGSVAALFAFGAIAFGVAAVVVDQTQRDDDGFLMSPSERFSSSTYAVVSESANIEVGDAERALDWFLGTVRIRSESAQPVFVGIAREADAAAYLDPVQRDVVTDLEDEPRYKREAGGAPSSPPGHQTFWVASTSGAGERTLEWEPKGGDWRVVLMSADGSRGVSSELSIGAELDSVLWIGIASLAVGAILAALAALAITAGIRSGRRQAGVDAP
jgi:uncharacterized protein DUF4389